jgi:hypothetical protein
MNEFRRLGIIVERSADGQKMSANFPKEDKYILDIDGKLS